MVYQTILFIGALLSAVHAASYAHHLWKGGQHRASLAVGCACLGVVIMAGRLMLQA